MAYEKIIIACLAFLSFAVTGFSEKLTVRLANGSSLTGDFTRQVGGLFLKTDTGGSQIAWKRLNPHSLPRDLQISLQNRLKLELDRADQFYRNDKALEAAPIYAKVLQHRSYLDLDTQTSPVFKDIDRKARGLVHYKDQWIPFHQRQEQLGLVLDRGKWIPRETAAVNAKFDVMQKQARLRTDYNRTMLDLLALIRQHPESDRIPEAEALVTRIDNWLHAKVKREQEAVEAAAKAKAVQPAPAPVQVVERIVEREASFAPYNIAYPGYQTYGIHRINYQGFHPSHGYNSHRINSHSSHRNHGSRNSHASRGASIQPGVTFKESQNRFNTGYPFAPPVSVQLTGQRTNNHSAHRQTRYTNQNHNHGVRSQPGLSVRGQIGNIGIRVQRKDPIKIRF